MEKSKVAAATFMVRVGQVGRSTEIRDTFTRPLFSLAMILEADQTLSESAARALGPEAEKRRERA